MDCKSKKNIKICAHSTKDVIIMDKKYEKNMKNTGKRWKNGFYNTRYDVNFSGTVQDAVYSR